MVYLSSRSGLTLCFVPRFVNFQTNTKEVPGKEVRVILLLDNVPAHLPLQLLLSPDVKARVEYLPPNTISLIQPIDRGMIPAFKNHYHQVMLSQVLVVELLEGEVDTHGEKTLANLKDTRDTLLNTKTTWEMVKHTNDCLEATDHLSPNNRPHYQNRRYNWIRQQRKLRLWCGWYSPLICCK